MLPSDYGPGDIEFWIEPPLLLSIQSDVKEILDKGMDSRVLSIIRELRGILEGRGLVRNLGSSIRALNAYAIDSSYPTPPLELIGGVMTVLSYGYVGYLNGSYDRYMTGEVVFEDVGEFERVITRKAQIRERELAIRLLKDKLKGRRDIDLVILDGEIPIHPLPYNLPVEGGVLARVTSVIGNLLDLSARTGTPIIGVVKRVRSKFLSVLINRCLPMNDKLIASLTLNNGEYMVLGSYGDILPPWIQINYNDCELRKRCNGKECDGVRELMSRRLSEGLVNIEHVFSGSTHPGLKMLKEVIVAFYKPRNGSPAVKLEIYNPSDRFNIEELITYLESQTTDTGYPFLIDRVDEYVRLDPRILDYVRSLIIKGSKDLNPALLTMLQLTNPQKAYLVKRLEA
ncbi:DNA double-strand break repair nuclease NurA [Vulcanisaeta souniana]|uniref:Nuclease n=1 Tax=Vulcanisaeta souniana JCM 11219 TaxID=1293586 RepID=A0A830E3F0_9CREN|nr:DNA double-strand break repair nuclease NurA [Vulcanisaeta souniana]BDR93272.1 nuclease [Vulcanisaeta souniana JCM 11219]GGI78881.1 nuclease [Vulcanisaeta souniana JCM 11219]